MFNNQHADARESFARAISLDSDYADAYRHLGSLLIMTGKISEGIINIRKAVSLKPQDSAARSHLALALYGAGRLADAIDSLQEALRINPNNAEAHSILLGFYQYLPDYSREKMFSDHVAFGELFEAPLRKNWYQHPKPINSHKRLRVGFVSGDLYSHPVGFFLEGALRELYRRDEVDIVIYERNRVVDALTDRLRAEAHVWRSVSALSDDAFERRVREDNIDILVDLSGHTIPNQLLVFARKPAPIQVTWLGYWETTGLRAIDYIFCDRYGVHDDEEKYFVEKPWRLPHTRLCFTLPNETIAVSPLPALSNGHLTLGCFNNLVKMTDRVIAVWSRILKRIPKACLLLKSQSFNDTGIRESVMARFAAEGISADRLELEVNSPRREYFTAYNRVDIALDPFPFPGGTTSVEGIWMGVPMITLSGDRIISRQGESILRNINLQDWIAEDEDDYVELAVRKAGDLASLAKLRSQLRQRLEFSPLCDAKLFAQHLEEAFKQMWSKLCD
jgi:predicted O-linked N-acetylglucosamine transferase (SPINDLY family)